MREKQLINTCVEMKLEPRTGIIVKPVRSDICTKRAMPSESVAKAANAGIADLMCKLKNSGFN